MIDWSNIHTLSVANDNLNKSIKGLKAKSKMCGWENLKATILWSCQRLFKVRLDLAQQ